MRRMLLLSWVLLVPSLSFAAPKAPKVPTPDKEAVAMLELADASRCLVCHDIDTTIRGPAWRDVAKRYRGNAEAEDLLVKRVYEGSAGHWGNDSMSSNKRAGIENIRILVRWILGLR